MFDSPRALRFAGLLAILFVAMVFYSVHLISSYKASRDGFHLNLRFNYIGDLVEGASVLLAGGKKIGFVEKIYQKELRTFVRIFLIGELQDKIPKNYSTQFAIFSASLTGQKYLNLQMQMLKADDETLKPEDEWFGLEPASLDTLLLGLSSWFEDREDNPEKVFDDIIERFKLLLRQVDNIEKENKADVDETLRQTSIITGEISQELDKVLSDLRIITDNYNNASTGNIRNFEAIQEALVKVVKQLNVVFTGLDKGKGTTGQVLKNPELMKNADEALKLATEFFTCITKNPLIFFNQNSRCED